VRVGFSIFTSQDLTQGQEKMTGGLGFIYIYYISIYLVYREDIINEKNFYSLVFCVSGTGSQRTSQRNCLHIKGSENLHNWHNLHKQ
jgi:hypothetical protein